LKKTIFFNRLDRHLSQTDLSSKFNHASKSNQKRLPWTKFFSDIFGKIDIDLSGRETLTLFTCLFSHVVGREGRYCQYVKVGVA